MWNRNPNCGIARERERTFIRKAIRHNLACSLGKGLSKYQRRASQLWTSPSPCRRQRGRRATARAGRRGAISAPEMAVSTKLLAGSQLLTKSSWYPVQLTSARRAAVRDQLPRGDTGHTWDGALAAHPGKPSGWDGGDKMHSPPGESALAKHLVTWSARTWEGHKTQAQPSLCLCWVPKNLNVSGLDLGMCTQPRARFRQLPCRAACSLSSVDRDSTHAVSGANPAWPRHCERSTHTPGMFVCSVLPSPQHAWTSDHLRLLVSGQKLDTEETCKQRKPKQTKKKELLRKWKVQQIKNL